MATQIDAEISQESDYSKSGFNWDLSQERKFMEDLVQQRFNFLLVVYSLVIAGAVRTESEIELEILLTIGSVICSLLALTVYHAHIKLDVLLKMLHEDESHPVHIVSKKIDSLGCKALFGVTWIIGIVVPILCTATLIIGSLLTFIGHLPVEFDWYRTS